MVERRYGNEPSGIDRLFRAAFWICRSVSAAFILICLLALGVGVGLFVYTYVHEANTSRPEIGATIETLPKFDELWVEMNASAQSQVAQPSASGDVTKAGNFNVPGGFLAADVVALVRKYKLGISDGRAIAKAADAVGADRDAFVSGLDPFLAGWSHLGEAKPPITMPPSDALEWYNGRFAKAVRAHEAVVSESRRKQGQASAEAAASRSISLQICLVAVAGMLAFIALPLLIQIERNTRE